MLVVIVCDTPDEAVRRYTAHFDHGGLSAAAVERPELLLVLDSAVSHKATIIDEVMGRSIPKGMAM